MLCLVGTIFMFNTLQTTQCFFASDGIWVGYGAYLLVMFIAINVIVHSESLVI